MSENCAGGAPAAGAGRRTRRSAAFGRSLPLNATAGSENSRGGAAVAALSKGKRRRSSMLPRPAPRHARQQQQQQQPQPQSQSQPQAQPDADPEAAGGEPEAEVEAEAEAKEAREKIAAGQAVGGGGGAAQAAELEELRHKYEGVCAHAAKLQSAVDAMVATLGTGAEAGASIIPLPVQDERQQAQEVSEWQLLHQRQDEVREFAVQELAVHQELYAAELAQLRAENEELTREKNELQVQVQLSEALAADLGAQKKTMHGQAEEEDQEQPQQQNRLQLSGQKRCAPTSQEEAEQTATAATAGHDVGDDVDNASPRTLRKRLRAATAELHVEQGRVRMAELRFNQLSRVLGATMLGGPDTASTGAATETVGRGAA